MISCSPPIIYFTSLFFGAFVVLVHIFSLTFLDNSKKRKQRWHRRGDWIGATCSLCPILKCDVEVFLVLNFWVWFPPIISFAKLFNHRLSLHLMIVLETTWAVWAALYRQFTIVLQFPFLVFLHVCCFNPKKEVYPTMNILFKQHCIEPRNLKIKQITRTDSGGGGILASCDQT